jgi:RHS repeat-associated protein
LQNVYIDGLPAGMLQNTRNYTVYVSPNMVVKNDGYTQNSLIESDQYFYHPDHLGSTSIITDKNGVATQFVAYMPFGESLVDEHSSRKEQPYKFSGKEKDEETGLSYFGARYYDSQVAVWYGADKLAEKYPNVGGYVYCFSNSIKLVDPNGYEPTKSRIQYNGNGIFNVNISSLNRATRNNYYAAAQNPNNRN